MATGACLCPVCGRLVPSTADFAFFYHVSNCVDDGRDATPFAAFAPLFRPRLHAVADIAGVGSAAASSSSWPMPPMELAAMTTSTRAMVMRGALSYALRDTDAQSIVQLAGGRALLLGSEAAARSARALSAAGVTSVVNCAFNSEPLPSDALLRAGVTHYTRLDFVDEAARAGQDSAALIRAGAAAVAEGIAGTRGAVLVHCVAGMSRSSSVVAAYLMLHEGYSLLDAMRAVKAARPLAHPNKGFWHALRAIEESVGRASSVPREAVEALHAGEDFPISTHVFGDAQRS